MCLYVGLPATSSGLAAALPYTLIYTYTCRPFFFLLAQAEQIKSQMQLYHVMVGIALLITSPHHSHIIYFWNEFRGIWGEFLDALYAQQVTF